MIFLHARTLLLDLTYCVYIIVAPANIEEGVSVHVDEDGEDLVVEEAVQPRQVLIPIRKAADVTL